MNRKIVFAEIKTYAYLYLMTAPFTYFIYEASAIGSTDDFIFLNIFIALALWVYLKKIRPLINEKGNSGINILLFLLVIIAILFSIKSASISSEVAEEVDSLNSKLYDVNSKLEDLDSKMDSLESDILSIKD